MSFTRRNCFLILLDGYEVVLMLQRLSSLPSLLDTVLQYGITTTSLIGGGSSSLTLPVLLASIHAKVLLILVIE